MFLDEKKNRGLFCCCSVSLSKAPVIQISMLLSESLLISLDISQLR